ncbi:hypothetical protein OCJ37_14430 [Xanthomonas sp. AM6]|uniref:hypothetical protein n=1 Tax=Xanthomonas sp. AM6 TaxID=2982531 RepID=UPI0021D8BFD2|nr:hypothetical protein [Xanthomonas sp. AM6]UYB51182.1 hypothetical protein OCJ37_14430 [Xanthomonas sp. AM6]
MTRRLSNLYWLDVLYNSVRRAPGGLAAAAHFLTQRRGKAIHMESLRAKLTAQKGEAISVEMAELLTEWMRQHANGEEEALQWLQVFGGQFGLFQELAPESDPNTWASDLEAIQAKALSIAGHAGRVCAVTADSMEDGVLDREELDEMVQAYRALRQMVLRAERRLLAAASKARRSAAA